MLWAEEGQEAQQMQRSLCVPAWPRDSWLAGAEHCRLCLCPLQCSHCEAVSLKTEPPNEEQQ